MGSHKMCIFANIPIDFNHIYITSIFISSMMLLSFSLLIPIRVMNNTIFLVFVIVVACIAS